MKIMKGGIENVKGIKAFSTSAGLKKSGKKDLAIVYSEKTANAAAVYTQNKVKGAPIIVTKNNLKNGKAQAIIINSGIANTSTGVKGINDAEKMCSLTADKLKINKNNVIVASTGVIGQYLPMEKIKKGIKRIKLGKKSVADAILTTDTVKKEEAVKVGNATIGAVAKGAGMLHPNMATMLCFILTDADISHKTLQGMLKKSVDKSFNMVSVDTDTSTNDMVAIMANGIAGKVSNEKFQKALDYVCVELAKKIAADGEGATKLIEVEVIGGKNLSDAKKVAKAIINSPLVKTAVFGNDPNFGRVLCAIGNSGASFKENKLDVYFQDKSIVKNGTKTNFNEKKISKLMKKEKFKILVNLKNGNASAMGWGCDLTYDYVKLNAEYHT